MSQIREPASFAEILDRPFGFLRAHLKALLTVHLALLLPLAVVIGIVQSSVQSSIFPFGGGAGPPEFPIGAKFPFGAFLLIYATNFAMLLGTVVAYCATYSATRQILDGEPVSVWAAYRDALRPRTLVTVFLTGIIVMLGFLCCLAPGLWALIYFVFTVPILCEGKLWGWEAVERSVKLVRYNPGRDFVKSTSLKVFLLFLIIGAITYAVTLLIALPALAIGMTTMFRAASKGFSGFPPWWPVLGAVQQVVSTIATSFVAIYSAAVFTMLYRDTRERMEGSSLEQALLQRLGHGPDNPGANNAFPLETPPDSPSAPGATDAGLPDPREDGGHREREDTSGEQT